MAVNAINSLSEGEEEDVTKRKKGQELTFPGASIAPPMTTTSLTLRNVSGSFAAAMARFVSGPTATMVIVPGSFSLNKSSMTSCAGLSDGVKSECFSLTFCSAAASSGARFFGWGVKRDFHVSSGERWGCCYASARILRGVGMVGKSLRYDVYLRVHRHRLR